MRTSGNNLYVANAHYEYLNGPGYHGHSRTSCRSSENGYHEKAFFTLSLLGRFLHNDRSHFASNIRYGGERLYLPEFMLYHK